MVLVLMTKHSAVALTMLLFLFLLLILLLSFVICTKIISNHGHGLIVGSALKSLFCNLALSRSFQKISDNVCAKLY